jgi:nucleoside-diphosphate-sugar epimerase
MKILVTGGAGYIGSVLLEKLLQRKMYQITVIDNFHYKQFSSLNHLLPNNRIDIVKGDVRDFDLVKKYASQSDVIIPLAAIVGAPACNQNPKTAAEINLDAPLRLLESLSESQLVIMPTTNSAYGTTPKGMITDENSNLNPLSQYAREKVDVEKMLLQRTNSVSLRLATVFGLSPRMRIDLLVNDLTYRAVKEGVIVLFSADARRNYIHVRDVVKVIDMVLDNPVIFLEDRIFNVGLSSANLTKLELTQAIQKFLPNLIVSKVENKSDPDKRDYLVSNERIEKLGFSCEFSLDEGIKELIKFFNLIPNFEYGNV